MKPSENWPEALQHLDESGPRRLLARQNDRQTIQVRDHVSVDRLVQRVQPRLVREELADGDRVLALLRELRPVAAHTFLVVEPATRVGDGEGHRGQALRGRVDDDHRVLLPRLTGSRVPNAAPQIDHLLTVVIGAAGATQFPSSSEVLGERLAHRLELAADVPFNRDSA
jgi:hypothetical protein